MLHNTKLVAILNITPDSFSDGGLHTTPETALTQIGRVITEGADVIDIGAESTRPGATPLTAEQEWQRLQPVLTQLPKTDAPFSLDTYHPHNAAQALKLGVRWINDVSGFSSPAMVEAVKDSNCKLVVMHSLSVPADKENTLPDDVDPIAALLAFATERFASLEQAGIHRSRLLFDPGIGFGKTAEQSRIILKRAAELKQLGVPLFIGHSRKSFLGMTGGNEEKDVATLAVSRRLAAAGVDYLRVHNVALHRAMLEEVCDVA